MVELERFVPGSLEVTAGLPVTIPGGSGLRCVDRRPSQPFLRAGAAPLRISSDGNVAIQDF